MVIEKLSFGQGTLLHQVEQALYSMRIMQLPATSAGRLYHDLQKNINCSRWLSSTLLPNLPAEIVTLLSCLRSNDIEIRKRSTQFIVYNSLEGSQKNRSRLGVQQDSGGAGRWRDEARSKGWHWSRVKEQSRAAKSAEAGDTIMHWASSYLM